MTLTACLRALTLLLAGLSAHAVPAAAQSGAVLTVNDAAITGYEIAQRAALLQALGATGDLVADATNRLIDERLQVQAATAAGLSASAGEIDEGVSEFAGRANADAGTFLAQLAARGVSEDSFRAFVSAGVLWRKFVAETFRPQIDVAPRDVEAELDRAGREPGLRVLLSEIVLPARNAEEAQRAEAILGEIAGITGPDAFAAAARSYSAAPSRDRGGQLDWLALSELPPPLRDQILGLRPGGVTAPLRAPNAIALFQLRAIEELPPAASPVETIDYAQFLAADAAEAARVAAGLDTCDDLYGVAKGLPAERLIREERAPGELPADLRAELDRLDRDEVSLRLTRGGRPAVTMLCARNTAAATAAAEDMGALRNRIGNRTLAQLAEAYLAELRADAVIVDLQ